MWLSNNNIPFSDNLITPTNKIKAYAPIDSELNLHKKGIEIRHEVGTSLGEPISKIWDITATPNL